jgi:CRISPR-associated protein Csm5
MPNNITLQTLTPLHIGSGKEYAGNFEFVYFPKEQKIAIINERAVYDLIDGDIDAWVKAIDKKKNLYDFLISYKPELKLADIVERTIEARDIPTNTLKAFMHDGVGKPFIAGSSLKGAIRTALFTHFIKENPEKVKDTNNLGNGYNYKDSKLMAHYLGTDPNHDLLRLLQIGDFYLKESKNTICLKSSIMNLFERGWGYKREQFNFVECLPAHTVATGTIRIAENLKKVIKNSQERDFLTQKFDYMEVGKLFTTVHEHTLELIKSELEFWEDEDINDDIEEYLNTLSEIQEIAQNTQNTTKNCILRVGAGSGWDFMTGGWAKAKDKKDAYILNDETWINLKRKLRRNQYHDDLTFPKTRKISQNQPLGFVKLSY